MSSISISSFNDVIEFENPVKLKKVMCIHTAVAPNMDYCMEFKLTNSHLSSMLTLGASFI